MKLCPGIQIHKTRREIKPMLLAVTIQTARIQVARIRAARIRAARILI